MVGEGGVCVVVWCMVVVFFWGGGWCMMLGGWGLVFEWVVVLGFEGDQVGCLRGKGEVVEEGEGEDGYVFLGLVVYLRLGGGEGVVVLGK